MLNRWTMVERIGLLLRPLVGRPGYLHLDEAEWIAVLTAAGERLMTPAIAIAQRDADLPHDLHAHLAAYAALGSARNADLVAAIGEIATMLNAIGVCPMPLKGAAMLLSGAYPDPALRVLGDLDLLVAENRLADCVEACERLGYAVTGPLLIGPKHQARAQYCARRRIQIELHHQPLHLAWKEMLPASIALDRGKATRIGGATILLPDPTDLALAIAVHAQLCDRAAFHGRANIRALLDTALIARHDPEADWEAVGLAFRSVGHERDWTDFAGLINVLLDVSIGGIAPIAGRRLLHYTQGSNSRARRIWRRTLDRARSRLLLTRWRPGHIADFIDPRWWWWQAKRGAAALRG